MIEPLPRLSNVHALDRYARSIVGVIGCYNRIVLQGTLPGLCFAEGMAAYLRAHEVRLCDYPRWAEPFREQVRENAEQFAKKVGIEIEFMRKTSFRKDDRIAEVLAKRGDAPGLSHPRHFYLRLSRGLSHLQRPRKAANPDPSARQWVDAWDRSR